MNQRLDAVAARKYTDKQSGEEKTAYTRIGVAWPFKDRPGYTVRLEAMPAPTDGEFTILLFEPKARDGQNHSQQQQSNDFGQDDGDSIPF